MVVTLVAPPVDFLSGVYGFRTRKRYRNQPPLGIGYVAAYLRQVGFAVHVLDAAAEDLSLAATVDRVLATGPDVIGVTAISYEAPVALELLRMLRARTAARLVMGGAHATRYHDEVVAGGPSLDAIVVGEGEHATAELLQAWCAGASGEGLAGVRVRRPDASFSPYVARPPVADLDLLPPPAYDLYPLHLYRPLPHRRKRLPSACMITSRGCSWGKCAYCELSVAMRGNYRRHSPARVVDEMKSLQRLMGARDIYFQDDIFLADPDWVLELAGRLEREKLGIIWSCETHVNGIAEPVLRAMARAGCWRVYIGFESGDQALLDRIHKGFTLAEARSVVRMTREAGMEVVGFFMIGLPGETPELARKTIDFSLSLGLDFAMYSLVVPHRDTELYDLCQQDGTIVNLGNFHGKSASFIPRGYRDAAEVEAMQRLAYRRFYLRPSYVRQCAGRIRTWEDARLYAEGALALFTFLD